jgi:Flp pilus assembly protein TadD
MRQSVEQLSREGRHAEAAEVLERLAAQSPGNPIIWNELGVECAAAGELDRAIEALRRGRAAYAPGFPPILFNLGRLLLQRVIDEREDAGGGGTGHSQPALEEAIALLNANLDREPENVEAHGLLAVAQRLAGREDLAEIHVRIAENMGGDTSLTGWSKG